MNIKKISTTELLDTKREAENKFRGFREYLNSLDILEKSNLVKSVPVKEEPIMLDTGALLVNLVKEIYGR